MANDRDEKNQEWSKDDIQWTKEEAKRDDRFDFAPFLGPESLEDRITDVLNGKDLLDKDAYGEYAPDYVPRRGAPGERGRHEAPGPDPEEEEPAEEEDQPDGGQPDDDDAGVRRFNSEDLDLDLDEDDDAPPFREEPPRRAPMVDEPPPRPKVVVAQPAPQVIVRPPAEYPPEETRRGSGKGMKWLIALLITAVVVVAALLVVTTVLPGLVGSGQPQDPSATHTDILGGLLRPRPTQAPEAAPTQVPAPTPPPAVTTYVITVTAGSGGSVSPSGRVDVREGESVTFTITPQVGYELGQLLIDGSNVSVQNSYTFSDVRQDHSIYAVFQPMQTATEPPPPVQETTPEPAVEETPEPPPVVEGEVGNLGPEAME